jgi:hypothetical protein
MQPDELSQQQDPQDPQDPQDYTNKEQAYKKEINRFSKKAFIIAGIAVVLMVGIFFFNKKYGQSKTQLSYQLIILTNSSQLAGKLTVASPFSELTDGYTFAQTSSTTPPAWQKIGNTVYLNTASIQYYAVIPSSTLLNLIK